MRYTAQNVGEWGGALWRLEPDGSRSLEWMRPAPLPGPMLTAGTIDAALAAARARYGRHVVVSTLAP